MLTAETISRHEGSFDIQKPLLVHRYSMVVLLYSVWSMEYTTYSVKKLQAWETRWKKHPQRPTNIHRRILSLHSRLRCLPAG